MNIEVIKTLSQDGYVMLINAVAEAAKEAISASAFADARHLAYIAEQLEEARK